ncbi:MAG: DNA polymerase III, delta prime subunit [uncultured bacterium]|nr:MAG: DNA polymerase III, delta prime subunit [uncultured bacterium]
MQTILPWQHTIWESLWQRKQQNSLPHALLFSGVAGVGKKQFAHVFAQTLLCHSSSQSGVLCGACRACHLLESGAHPDLMWVEPEEAGQMIKVEQIRHVVHFVNETALLSGYRIILIPASLMNVAAANALLKTLEEPTSHTLLILICEQTSRLPATITSRCQRVVFSKPSKKIALQWLEVNCQNKIAHTPQDLDLLLALAEGAPLSAKEFLLNGMLALRQEFYQNLLQLSRRQADPLQLAARWQEHETLFILNLLFIWLRDLLRAKLTHGRANLINVDHQVVIQEIMQKFSCDNLLQYIAHIQQMYSGALRFLNTNKILLLEELFIRWAKLCF